MEGLGVAASIIAVIDLSAKVAKLCIQYSLEVTDAKSDISRLHNEIENVGKVVSDVQHLDVGSNGAKLSASKKMLDAVNDCSTQLKTLERKLDPGKTTKAMRRLGIRALKWPFQSKQVDKVIRELERCKGTVLLALQVDQTELLQGIHQKIDLSKLPSAEGAAFDSYVDELDARCHPETRIDLLRQIKEWGDDPQGKCIFWLNGMAGTGKSTISRTVAQSFADDGKLGASFFFKRGEGERGNASRFFTTIAAQLVRTVSTIIPYLSKAIDADPGISGKVMKEQFENLIFQPLSEVGQISGTTLKLVVVIDALDECEREGDIRNILHLLSQTQHLSSIHIRIFLTSRPELPIRLGFKKPSAGAHQDVILQDIPKGTIKHDISSFLKAEFKKIGDDYNNSHPEESSLPQDWPGEQNIRALSEMAVPLFIFAATVSRFVGDPRWNPKKRLADVLKYQMNGQASKLDKTYLPVLDHLMTDLSDPEKEDLVREFRAVIGSIIVLVEPLGTSSLARLLNIAEETIDCRLDSLHSVLSIPSSSDSPIRLLHLSFREFLLDPYKQQKSPFWVDEKERHEAIAISCLELMFGRLDENICHLGFPGEPRGDIDRIIVEKCLPADVRYACRYWIHHFIEARGPLRDQDAVYTFLQKHFLHWLEALSLIGRISDSIAMIGNLQSVVAMNGNAELSLFLSDARRFILQNRSIIDYAPLQLYSSAIVFAPKESIIRSTFEQPIPWISQLPKVPQAWSLELQKLEGHSRGVNAVAFSHDGELLASASDDGTVRLWNPATGEQVQQLEGHSNRVNAVAFSHDGQLLASASYDNTVRLWNPATGEQVQQLEGHYGWVNAVAFSHDGQLLASASDDKTVRLWNPATGERVRRLGGHNGEVNAVAFSHNGELLASASDDNTVRLWNPATREQVQQLEGHYGWVYAVAFSHDGELLASASDDNTVRLWNPATGEQVQQLEGHNGEVYAVAFSHDGQLLASASSDNTVRLWNPATGEQVQQLEGHSGGVNAVAFSHDGQLLASASSDNTVRLWNPATGEQVQQLGGHNGEVNAVAFSHDGQLLASASDDNTVRLWNPATGEQVQQLEGHYGWVYAVAFSHDGQLLASVSSDNTVRLWNPATGEQVQQLGGHSGKVSTVAFSHDGELLASASYDNTVRLWNPATGEQVQQLEGHSGRVSAVAFSHDGQLLVSASDDKTVRLWNPATGEQVQQLEGHGGGAKAVAFSHDGQLLASASDDNTVRLWNPATGEQVQQLEGHSDGVRAVAFSHDGELLASASYDKTVRLWNPTTGEEVETLEQGVAVYRLRFSSDSQCLETDKGILRLHSRPVTVRSLAPKFAGDIFLSGDWITYDGRNFLWLPHDYRGTCSASRSNLLVIGQSSGQVHFIECSPLSV